LADAPCVRSGFCCKQAPCIHGKAISPANSACKYLVGDRPGYYSCGIYDWIVANDSFHTFNTGCSSTLFNDDRDEVIVELIALGGMDS